MVDDEQIAAEGDEVRSGLSPLLLVAAAAAVLVLGLVGWLGWQWRQSSLIGDLVQQTQAAIDAGDLSAAEAALAEAVADAPDRADVRWAEGRLAHARGRNEIAVGRLREAWKSALEGRWPVADRALVARELADALATSGDLDGALAVNDRVLADLLPTIDEHLDRDDLGPGGLPRPGSGAPTSPVAMRSLALLRQRGRIAAERAGGLLRQGDRTAAMRILDAGQARIGGTVCTGTHRVYCRGHRAALRDLAGAPIRRLRVRDRIDRALALVEAERYEDALELAEEAGDGAIAGAEGDPRDARAAEDAARVAYAVHVAWGAALEKKKAWADAKEQYGKAAALHPKTGLKETPHQTGQRRTQAVAGVLDETSSVMDRLAGIGLGDDQRRRFHQRIEADPVNPRIYAEEALSQARAARLAGDAEQTRQLEKRAERYLEVGRTVAPEDRMAGFYGGVTRFLAGYPKQGLEAMRKAYKGGYRDRAAELYMGEAHGLRGQHGQAADHWQRAWKLRPTDTYVGRRAIESLLAAGRTKEARAVLLRLLEERTVDEHLIEAQVMLHFHAGEYDNLRKVLAMDRWRFTAGTPDPVRRVRRIADAVYNKMGERVTSELLEEGEELIDRVYGYAIPADAEGLLTGRKVQSALLVLTTRRAVLLRWDAARDYKQEVRTGVALARRAARLGFKLSGEWAGLDVGDGIERLARLLDLLPEADRRAEGGPGTAQQSVDLVIESLELIETLRKDFELQVKREDVRIHEIAARSIISYDLLPVRPGDGLYALYARARDGRSPWHTDADRLYVYTTRPARLRMFMDRYLLARPAPTAAPVAATPATAPVVPTTAP